MLLLSWNVAGLSTTVQRIHEAYGDQTKTTTTTGTTSCTALATYFARHGGADIVCLQEHKIPKTQLASRSEPRHASRVPGYESFWSCCVDERKKGLNGVVTFARRNVVVAADPAPLGSPELDAQGRCVMTDHGTFCLFNVYVPASGGQPLAFKMKFLNALRRAMQRQPKPCILVGDLNIAHGTRDVYWKDRVVYVQDVRDQVERAQQQERTSSSSGDCVPQWKLDLWRSWERIRTVMQTKQVVETQTTNSRTKEKYDKFRLAVTIDGGRRVFLGSHEVSKEYCEYCYDFSAWAYRDEDAGRDVLAREEDTVRLRVLAELMSKIAGIHWDDSLLREIAETDATVDRASPTRKWLTAIQEEDGMVDTFRHFYPSAEARFTCWHQFTNKRYENDGARIDYVLVDKRLLPHVLKGEVCGLRCCSNLTEEESLGERGALLAATATGRFRPVSFEGGGIDEATQEALDTQFGPAHTGLVYTPPSFSDHIGVSLLTDDALLWDKLVLLENDTRTRKAQPHKLQKSIASFFTKSDAATTQKSTSKGRGSSSMLGPSKRLKPAPKPSANSILYHFKKKA